MSKVVLDTSILLLLYERVDIFGDIERLLDTRPQCIVPYQVVAELERLSKSPRFHTRKAANLALQALEKHRCRVVHVRADTADDAIVAIVSGDCTAIPATADRRLRRRLRERGVPTIFYRAERRGLDIEY